MMGRAYTFSKAAPAVTRGSLSRELEADLTWNQCREERWLNKQHEYHIEVLVVAMNAVQL